MVESGSRIQTTTWRASVVCAKALDVVAEGLGLDAATEAEAETAHEEGEESDEGGEERAVLAGSLDGSWFMMMAFLTL